MLVGWFTTLYRAYERISKLMFTEWLSLSFALHLQRNKPAGGWYRHLLLFEIHKWAFESIVATDTCSYLLVLFLCLCWYSVFYWQLVSASEEGSDEEVLDDWIKISSEKTENSLLHKVAFQCEQWLPYECCDHKQQNSCCPQGALQRFFYLHTLDHRMHFCSLW